MLPLLCIRCGAPAVASYIVYDHRPHRGCTLPYGARLVLPACDVHLRSIAFDWGRAHVSCKGLTVTFPVPE